MNILTNRLKINFNIDAIKEDFVFIRLERKSKDKKDKWYGRRELDYLFGKDFDAKSVLFEYGKFAYAMFKNPVDVYQLLSRIRANEEFQNNEVIEVTPLAILDPNKDCICEAWLAQILLNSLSASKSRFPQYQYCNLTGSLLLVRDFEGKNKDCLDVAKITITSDFLLKIEIVRYRTKISILSEFNKVKKTGDKKRITELQNALNKPSYKFEPSNASLRIHLASDGEIDPKLTYIQCQIQGKKASAPFIEFGSSDDFYKSRAGILHDVKTNIDKNLSKYMTVDFSSREYEIDDTHTINNILMDKPQNIQPLINDQKIHIVDRVNNEESRELINDLKELLYQHYITKEDSITVGKIDKKDAFNFRIIHDKSYYDQHDIKDDYKPSDSTTQRQNITIESNNNLSLAIVKTIIKELIIKQEMDNDNRKLTLFDWSQLKYEKSWKFGVGVYSKEFQKIIRFIFMNIEPDGSFTFSEINSNLLEGYQEYHTYIYEIEKATKNEYKTGLKLEGLVVSEDGDINLLFRTNEMAVPNLPEIAKIIDQVQTPLPEDKNTGNTLADLIDKFTMQSMSKDSDKLSLLIDELKKLGHEEINKTKFKEIINNTIGKNSNVTKELREYLLNEYNIRMIFPKDKQNSEELFNMNIKYFKETETEAYYFVGQRDINKYSFKDACYFRKIVAVNGSKLIFKELLPTMDVDFVRTGQSTVIPFPFKYIREYLNFDVSQ
ncbi:MAG: hypothetical protein HEQ26_20965 [Dolichospermum sp. DL01]|nr:MAG: hypothetical protein HEQ26_20965 [Dolichospermum sp. DL01]